jgi:hypothetical protein
MQIKLIHPFRYNAQVDWVKILEDVNTLQRFENRIKKHCDGGTEYLTEDEKGQKVRTFLGDAWEVFTEMLMKAHPFDRRLGLSDYKPCHPSFGNEDHGVDGRGTGTNSRPATLQAKFRGNPTDVLTANGAHLVNFKNSSHEEYNVKFEDVDNMLIVTNCKGLHYYTEEKMLNKKVRCIARDHIQQMVDNNNPFWDEFRTATIPI